MSAGPEDDDPERRDDADGSGPADAEPATAPGRSFLWLGLGLLVVAVVAGLWLTRGPQVRGDLDGLIPVEHRAPREHIHVILWRDPEHETTAADLATSADRIRESVGDRWVPIAAPAAEVAGWLDAHALYLLPVGTHDALAKRLSDDAIATRVSRLRARLSSPFFAVGSEDARRDPLALAELAEGAAEASSRRLESGWSTNVTPTGDLVTKDSTALLMLARNDRSTSALRAELAELVEPGVEVSIAGPEAERVRGRALVASSIPTLLSAALAAITILLALALRRVRQAGAIVVCIAAGGATIPVLLTIDPLCFPLVILLLGYGSELGLPLTPIAQRRWVVPLVLATALAPLALSDYPLWIAWSWGWGVGLLLTAVACALFLGPALRLLQVHTGTTGRRFFLRPMPVVAVVLGGLLLGGGFWAADQLRLAGADRFSLGAEETDSGAPDLADTFYNPDLVARVASTAPSRGEALGRAAVDARLLGEWVPDEVAFVDSPGRLVLPTAELERRRVALRDLDLPGRLAHLAVTLENAGFRPAAFGEFLRSATDRELAPTVDAALESPLARWIERYVEDRDGEVALHSEVHLTGNPRAIPPDIETEDGRRLELRGPAVAARSDLKGLRDRIGFYVLCQLWLGAVLVWLARRSLSVAVASAAACLMTHTGLLLLLSLLDVVVTPAMLPALLLVGAASIVASARACTAIETGTPLFASGQVLASGCQVAAGATLMSTSVPSWTSVGYLTAIGSVLAVGIGLFVAPGLATLVGGLRRSGSDPDQIEEDS